MNNNDNDRNNEIVNIDNLDTITNGTLEDMSKIINPNQVGQVIYKDNGEVKTDINPMIMIINQGLNDYRERLEILVKNGGDLDMNINYCNRETTPRELAIEYRDY
jgi:hypothetical protein